ncbi:MAG: protease pro-enzyme activation domain-containing protein, partial [Acidobacteriota bacterium]|nr:protease pro-enzyme activation domain-containing protein [Acidobacteriota bacterium]
ELRGADPASAEQVESFARSYGLTVGAVDLASRTIQVKGSVNNFERAFGTKLLTYESRGIQYRAPEGELRVPAAIAGSIEAVTGLSTRPAASPHA